MEVNEQNIYKALELVMDPEIPVLNVLDLGMITSVTFSDKGVHVKMIPTFAACPAVELIRRNIRSVLQDQLHTEIMVEIDKQESWNSNRMTESAKEKLKNFGITPPKPYNGEDYSEFFLGTTCPHCNGNDTYLRSPFGSTLCRAIHFCKDCGQVFEHFKPLD
jgi:ring-1,2-phenylacetyl-CoA epoxidase subunit PaaD